MHEFKTMRSFSIFVFLALFAPLLSFGAELSNTDQLISTLSYFHEIGEIGNDELLELKQGADAGDVRTAIRGFLNLEVRTVNTVIMHSALSDFLDNHIESEKVALWANATLNQRQESDNKESRWSAWESFWLNVDGVYNPELTQRSSYLEGRIKRAQRIMMGITFPVWGPTALVFLPAGLLLLIDSIVPIN